MHCAEVWPTNRSQPLPGPCYCPGVKAIVVLLSIALATGASAKPVSGPIKSNSTFGRGLDKKAYTLVINMPSGFEAKRLFGALTVEKSFFEELKFELSSMIPRDIAIEDASWVIQDATAKSEVLLKTKTSSGEYHFSLYRRLNPANPRVLLNCSGDAETQAVYQAMLNICRTAKLK